MRTVVQLALVVAVGVVTANVAGTPADVQHAAAIEPLTTPITSVSPGHGEVVGVAHPIVVTFGSPIPNRLAAERSLTVKSSPAMTGKFEWLDDATVQWVPDRYWPAHSSVKMLVDDTMTEFETGAAVVGVADISEHTFTVTIDGSSVGLPAPHHLPHAGEEGVLLATMGRPEYATPVGSYTVLEKEDMVVMDSSSVGIPITDPDGYYLEVENAVRFTRRGLFVHSAPWAVPVIGYQNVSHGCISLMPDTAKWYFDTAKVGDPVIVQE